MKKVSMKKIAFVMTIAVAVAWNFPTALIAGASERVGAVDVLDTTETDRKSTRLNSSHTLASRMPSSA